MYFHAATIALATLIGSPVVVSAVQPPAAGAKQADVYDTANAAEQIDKAIARAARENRRVLIQWGANWCSWCRLLHEKCRTDKDIAKKLLYEFDVVLVDVGQFDKNMDLAAKYKADLKGSGIPFLTILDSTGKPIANQETSSLESKDPAGHDAKKVVAFLTEHQAKPVAAADVLAAGLSRATKDNKRVLLHFGAPWCGWCHRLDAWLEKPEVAALVAKDFVEVKIDQDRMPGGGDVLKQYNTLAGKPGGGGIPWMVILSAEGKTLADSNAPGSGNVGFPAQPEEIAHFISMLEKAKQNLSAKDIAAIKASLEAESPAPAVRPAK